VIASLLVILFRARVTALVPLWAVGVFLSFTLSQTGMARRWWKIGRLKLGEEARERSSTLRFDPGWRGLVINDWALVTAVVTVIFAATKLVTAPGSWCCLSLRW
jgi:hypothetical protein